ncbi:MAG: glycosyltransferase [Nitrospinae bacterium]|nr:glycosyltransferase [Nitrospinota bacterium]
MCKSISDFRHKKEETCIIPTLNSARILRDCLDSVAIQDYPKEKIEIIIADGGSTS